MRFVAEIAPESHLATRTLLFNGLLDDIETLGLSVALTGAGILTTQSAPKSLKTLVAEEGLEPPTRGL